MTRFGNEMSRRLAILRLRAAALLPRQSMPWQPVSVMGMTFRNPLGAAAGFDRDGRLIPLLEAAGFGFVEIGTVTPERAQEVARRLAAAPARHCVVALNIGSLHHGLDATVLDDYRACLRQLAPVTDFLVANLSCPRMARLRGTDTAKLTAFLGILRNETDRLAEQLGRTLRLAVKVQMQQTEAALVVDAAIAARLDGLVAVGGDIPVLAARAASLALISVGGIRRAVDVSMRLSQGANLVEVYTALTHGGITVPSRLLGRQGVNLMWS